MLSTVALRFSALEKPSTSETASPRDIPLTKDVMLSSALDISSDIETVAVLEKDPQCPNLAFARKNGIPVRLGHSREEGVFDDLNVAKAKSIILATNEDPANLEGGPGVPVPDGGRVGNRQVVDIESLVEHLVAVQVRGASALVHEAIHPVQQHCRDYPRQRKPGNEQRDQQPRQDDGRDHRTSMAGVRRRRT